MDEIERRRLQLAGEQVVLDNVTLSSPSVATRCPAALSMLMDALGTREFADVVTHYEPGRSVAHRSDGGSFVARKVRRNFRQDLAQLKAILESRETANDPV